MLFLLLSLQQPTLAVTIDQSFTYDALNRVTSAGSNGYSYDAAGNMLGITASSAPAIVVEQPSGTALSDGVLGIVFGSVSTGSSTARVVAIRNTGDADLTSLAVTKDGTHSTDFVINSTGMLTTLTPGNSTTFTVTFNPSAIGTRSAALHIASNMSGSLNPFDIGLTGTGIVLVPTISAPTATSIVMTSATLGGNITGDGGAAISERGVVYAITATNSNPVIGGTGVTKQVIAGTTGVFSAGVSGLATNTTYSFKAYAINSAGTSYTSPVSTFTTLNELQDWRQAHFGTSANTGSAADAADFDHDGIPNLIEWACNLNPATNSVLSMPTTLVGGNIEFTYVRSKAAVIAGAVFVVEWTDTLVSTSWSTTGVSSSIQSDNGSNQQMKATLPAGGNGRRFVRLGVTAPP